MVLTGNLEEIICQKFHCIVGGGNTLLQFSFLYCNYSESVFICDSLLVY